MHIYNMITHTYNFNWEGNYCIWREKQDQLKFSRDRGVFTKRMTIEWSSTFCIFTKKEVH